MSPPRSRSTSRARSPSRPRTRSRSGSAPRRSRSRERSRSPLHKSRHSDSRKRDRLDSRFTPTPITPKKREEPYMESSDSESDEDGREKEYGTESREKKMRKVDTNNPYSTFEYQTRTRKQYLVPTPFVKERWLKIRGMDEAGKFVSVDESKPESWKHVAKSDKLIKKFSGEIFSETKLDDGLHSIVDKNESGEMKDLTKYQKIFGSIGHLSLKTLEGYGTMYRKFDEFVNRCIGPPREENPEWKGEEETPDVPQYIWADYQIKAYTEHQANLQELQVDVAEPLSSVTRVAASAFTNMLDKRREKVLSKIGAKNKNAASAIGRIPPSSSSMFGGDHSQLEKTVQLTKDLTTSGEKSGGSGGGSRQYNKPKPRGGAQGSGGSHYKRDQGKGDSSGGGNNNNSGSAGGSGGSRGRGGSFRGNSGRGRR